MHFFNNLSAPVQQSDQELQQRLRDRLGSLPPVSDLASEEAMARIERLAGQVELGEFDGTREKKSAKTPRTL